MSTLTRHRLAVAAAIVLLGACGGDSGTSGERTEVSFLTFGEPEELRAFRAVVDAFEQEQPRVAVKLVEASDREDLIARLSTSFAGGEPPDVFLLNYRYYGQFAARDVIEPIDERLEASDVFDEGDFYRQALAAFRFGGKLTCLPQNVSSLVVYYNRDMFREASLAEPKAGWTWTDMVKSAVALTRDLDGDGVADQHGLGVEPSLIRIAPFVWSNGGQLFDDEERPTRFALDERAKGALTQFFALAQGAYPVVPSDEEVEAEDDETRFQNGRTGMVLSSRRSTPTFRTITDFDWDVAPLPRHDEPAGILHSDGYCMAAASRNKDAAWEFMQFAVGPEGQRITAESGRTVPSLVDVANSEAFLDPNAEPASSRVFLDTIPVIRRVPTISTWPQIEDAAEPILERGFYEGIPVDQVARQLETATADIFARGER